MPTQLCPRRTHDVNSGPIGDVELKEFKHVLISLCGSGNVSNTCVQNRLLMPYSRETFIPDVARP